MPKEIAAVFLVFITVNEQAYNLLNEGSRQQPTTIQPIYQQLREMGQTLKIQAENGFIHPRSNYIYEAKTAKNITKLLPFTLWTDLGLPNNSFVKMTEAGIFTVSS